MRSQLLFQFFKGLLGAMWFFTKKSSGRLISGSFYPWSALSGGWISSEGGCNDINTNLIIRDAFHAFTRAANRSPTCICHHYSNATCWALCLKNDCNHAHEAMWSKNGRMNLICYFHWWVRTWKCNIEITSAPSQSKFNKPY